MAKALHSIVAADDHAHRERSRSLQLRDQPGLHVQVELPRHPRGDRPLERTGRVRAERRETLALGWKQGET